MTKSKIQTRLSKYQEVYIHGKITIVKNNKEVANLDSDNNANAKTLKSLKTGDSLKIVSVPIVTPRRYDSPNPPVYGIKLGQDAYGSGV